MLVGDLSLGLQRQVAFLAALAHAPAVLVLDEPTSGVDPLARAALWDTIREQADRGTGVLVTTHYMQEAAQCDRLLLMSRARLVAQGSEADIVGDTPRRRGPHGRLGARLRGAERGGRAGHARRTRRAGRGLRRRAAARGARGGRASPPRSWPVPATIEERMMVLAREAPGGRS